MLRGWGKVGWGGVGWGGVGWGGRKVFETRVTSDQGNAGN